MYKRQIQTDALVFAHGDDFFNRAPGAAGEDGIGRFAELFQFSQCPRRAFPRSHIHFFLISDYEAMLRPCFNRGNSLLSCLLYTSRCV